jgi:hypothetical protein
MESIAIGALRHRHIMDVCLRTGTITLVTIVRSVTYVCRPSALWLDRSLAIGIGRYIAYLDEF